MSGAPGRPLSAELSEQLVSVAIDILAEEGWGRLNSDRIAARARAGKAGIYRRWPTMAALALCLITKGWAVDALLYLGLVLTLAVTVEYLADGYRFFFRPSSST